MTAAGLTAQAAGAAAAAFAAPVTATELRDLQERLAAVARIAAAPLDADLAAWSRRIAGADGFPLLGTGLLADTGAALLWGGARLARGGAGPEVAAVLAGLAAGEQAASSTGDLARGVTAARAVAGVVARSTAGSIPLARPTTAALGAAACAALLLGVTCDALAAVLDTAASLMVLTPGGEVAGAQRLAPLWVGHAAAAGWLASVLPATGVTALPGALTLTLTVATGSPTTDRPAPTPADVRDLVGALS